MNQKRPRPLSNVQRQVRDLQFRWCLRLVEAVSGFGRSKVFWKATDHVSLLNSRWSESDLKRLSYEERTKSKRAPNTRVRRRGDVPVTEDLRAKSLFLSLGFFKKRAKVSFGTSFATQSVFNKVSQSVYFATDTYPSSAPRARGQSARRSRRDSLRARPFPTYRKALEYD